MSDVVTVTFPAFELRVPDLAERTIEGIVVPWNETSYLTPEPRGERFLPGSLTRTVNERGARVKLYRGHDHDRAIGRPLEWNPNHETGLWARFRIASGQRGDEILDEVREGMLDAFSIGFRTVRHRRGSDGAREVLEASLHETSLAPVGAYDGAQVLAMRTPTVSDLPPMPVVNLDPIGPLRHSLG